MRHFIDRRMNPKDKNLGNRQRFIRRARDQLRRVINESIKAVSYTHLTLPTSIQV